jgi:hypothetical protein
MHRSCVDNKKLIPTLLTVVTHALEYKKSYFYCANQDAVLKFIADPEVCA